MMQNILKYYLIFFILAVLILIYVGSVLSSYVHVYNMHALRPQSPEWGWIS